MKKHLCIISGSLDHSKDSVICIKDETFKSLQLHYTTIIHDIATGFQQTRLFYDDVAYCPKCGYKDVIEPIPNEDEFCDHDFIFKHKDRPVYECSWCEKIMDIKEKYKDDNVK